MIRRVQMSISESNIGKLSILDKIFEESKRVINIYINELWKIRDFSSKFISFKVDTWFSARLQQALGKQALEIIKSQRRNKKKYKPTFRKNCITIDSRFIEIQFDNNTFDTWFKLSCIGNKISLRLPSQKHKHFYKYKNWELKKSYRLRNSGKRYFLDVMFEKKAIEPKTSGDIIGIDIGYKKLIATSECKTYDTGLETIYNKITKKKQGSIAFKRALKERDNKINESVNKLPIKNIKMIVAEDLKNVKHRTKGKIFKKFNNKLQRWSYAKVLNMLSLRCEEYGIYFKKINSHYTSQTCSNCGFRHKDNRHGEKFLCLKCGFILDADYNAAKNILTLGSL